MKLKDIKDSAARLIQNALQVFVVTCIYGYDTRKKHRELRYRLNTIRRKVQQTIIEEDKYHKMNPDWPRLCRYDVDHLFSEYEDCIVQISYLNKDLNSLNYRPNRSERRWRERFTLDLNTIWNVVADHQWAIQNDIDVTDKSYTKDYAGSLSVHLSSNNSIWCTASVSGSSCYAQSLSGSSISGSSSSLQSLSASVLVVQSLHEEECVSKCDQDSADDFCDGQYEKDLLEFLNGFQIDC